MKNIALITGGARGMGFATAKILGADYHIALCDVNEDNLSKASTELAKLNIVNSTHACDISKPQDITKLFESLVKIGQVKILVHAAGVSPHMGNAEKIMEINALGTIYLTKAFLAIAEAGACQVNIASMAGYLLPNIIIPSRAYPLAFADEAQFFKRVMRRVNLMPAKQRAGLSYSISKNFASWYSKKSARAFGEKGARILSISPGSFETEMGKLEKDHGAEAMLQMAAIKRFGKVEEVAELIAFMASEKQTYTTGIDIPCDGGITGTFTFKELRKIS